MKKDRRPVATGCMLALLVCLLVPSARAAAPGLPDELPGPDWLNHWTFDDTTNWTSVLGYPPVSFTNLNSSPLGDGSALVLDSTNAAWLHYRITETNGTNHLRLDQGSVIFWFAPWSWAGTNNGGTGPGQWGRLLEVGSYTTNASYGWWSLYLDPAGANVYFAAQTNNGSQAVYLSAPIDFQTNRWHLISLTYSATNSALFLDGELVTNGLPVTYLPGPDVLTNGFWIGSDSSGGTQARGMFDDLITYDYELDADTIRSTFGYYFLYYYLNPMNRANIASSSSSPTNTPTFQAVSGSGYLTPVSNTLDCVTSTNVWITNLLAQVASNGTMQVTFEIAGGTNGLNYDVFASSVLSFATNITWCWMGQGVHCVKYSLTNLPITACFLTLGTPQDTDQDGLTDAYEKIASHTDPNLPDSKGDGILDGWKVIWGLNLHEDNPAQSGQRSTLSYTPTGWLKGVSGIRAETVVPDAEGNISQDSQY